MALRSTGLSQSGQRTTPMSDFSGSAPNVFMSRAESHDVGGDGSSASNGSVCDLGGSSESHENGGGELLVRLSFKNMVDQQL